MSDPLHDTLGYRDQLPLRWQPLAAPLAPAPLQALQEQNLRMLAVVAALEERHQRPHDAHEPLLLELEKLQQKLDLMMLMFGRFLSRLDPPAPTRALRLSVSGVCWQPGDEAPADGPGLLQLHLHPCVPEPLTWPARLVGRHGDEVCARFDAFGEALEAALERHVFLHHRRSVAGSRPAAA